MNMCRLRYVQQNRMSCTWLSRTLQTEVLLSYIVPHESRKNTMLGLTQDVSENNDWMTSRNDQRSQFPRAIPLAEDRN